MKKRWLLSIYSHFRERERVVGRHWFFLFVCFLSFWLGRSNKTNPIAVRAVMWFWEIWKWIQMACSVWRKQFWRSVEAQAVRHTCKWCKESSVDEEEDEEERRMKSLGQWGQLVYMWRRPAVCVSVSLSVYVQSKRQFIQDNPHWHCYRQKALTCRAVPVLACLVQIISWSITHPTLPL